MGTNDLENVHHRSMTTWRVVLGTCLEAKSREEAWAKAKKMIRDLDPDGQIFDSGPLAVSENMQWPW